MSYDKAKDVDNFFGTRKNAIDIAARRKAVQYSYRLAAATGGVELVKGDSKPSQLFEMGSWYKKDTGHSWHDRQNHPEIYSDSNVRDVAYSCRLRAVDLGHEFVQGDKANYQQMLEKFERAAGYSYQGRLVD